MLATVRVSVWASPLNRPLLGLLHPASKLGRSTMATCAAVQPKLLLELSTSQSPLKTASYKGFHSATGLVRTADCPWLGWQQIKGERAGRLTSLSQHCAFTMKTGLGGVRCHSTMPTAEPPPAIAKTAADAAQNEPDLFFMVQYEVKSVLPLSVVPQWVLTGELEVGDAQLGTKDGAHTTCTLIRKEDLSALQKALGPYFDLVVTPWTAVINSLHNTLAPREPGDWASWSEGKPVVYQLLEYEYVEDVLQKRGPYRDAHLKLAAEKCILGGPKGDPIDGAYLLFAPGEDDKTVVTDFVSQDPYVAAGLVTSHSIRSWKIHHFDPDCFLRDSAEAGASDAEGDAGTSAPSSSRLSSMSGFSRVDGRYKNKSWSWEVKSVNGRGLDVRARVPSAYSSLEQAATAAAADRFTRGSVSCFLEVKVEQEQQDRRIVIDDDAMFEVIAAYERVCKKAAGVRDELPAMDYGHLLRIPGIVRWEEAEETEEEREELGRHMTDSLHDALDRLLASRAAEGDRLRAVLSNQVAELEALVDQAAEASQERIPQLKERLQKQVSELVETTRALDPGRLEQEVALLTTKLDVREEIDRLRSHIVAAKALLDGTPTSSSSPRKRTSQDDSPRPLSIGRQLDFLCQEFTRECSTICSKSSDVPLTQLALRMRGVSEQIKEQAANVQ